MSNRHLKESIGQSEQLNSETVRGRRVVVEKHREDVREKITALLQQLLQQRIPEDWIQNVTPEMIRHIHRALEDGVSEEIVLADVLEEIIVGAQKDASSHQVLQQLVQLSSKDPLIKAQLKRMVEIASKLHEHGYQLPIYDIMTLAGSGSLKLLESEVSSDDRQEIQQLLAA